MSMSISRASYTGDPGFWDIFKKAATIGTSFIPFVGPTISQAIAGSGTGPGSVPTNGTVHRSGRTTAQEQERCRRAGGQTWGGPGVGCQQPTPGFLGAAQRLFPGGATGMMPAGAMNGASMGGYHLNKSDYFLKSGEYVPAGTRWVKNRKRNPANSRATSRAISRVVGAKKYTASLSRISIRKKC